MKRTLLFSNVIGDIMSENAINECKFNSYMEEYLKLNIKLKSNLVFINAPGFGNEENYLPAILSCFKKINISFDKIFNLEDVDKLNICDLNDNINETVYFLMGGNPITQMDIIIKSNLLEQLKNYDGLVIGFCAGAINLSKYSIITSDEEFEYPSSYLGINRINECIEPHYNHVSEARTQELLKFSDQYNTEILAIPDESILIIEDEKIIEKGIIHHIKKVF